MECATRRYSYGRTVLLHFKTNVILETMGCTIGPIAADSAAKYKAERIETAEHRSSLDSKEARTAHQNEISAENEQFEEPEGLLYGHGIAD
ncbi:unnamed protein product [Euphydryas editha]|uniref:Uncharacterized protein n=1 Tax=Euphydryas editha TaxID=104508 RepID=A0AAU9V1A0_EUPED|nr:unnamed protein product [Euphydryas editha]